MSEGVHVLSGSRDILAGFDGIDQSYTCDLWGSSEKIRYSADALILDTPLPDLTADMSYVEEQRKNLKETIESLSTDLIGYLKRGGVVIVLCSHHDHNTLRTSQNDNLGWLAKRFDFEYSIYDSPLPVVPSTDIGPVKSYLEYVDTSYVCLRNFATPVEPIAQPTSGGCKTAVLLNSYFDPSLKRRTFDGKVVLLPRPRSIAPVNVQIARHLLETAEYFSPKSIDPGQTSLLEFDVSESTQKSYDQELDQELEAKCMPKIGRGEYSDAFFAAGKLLAERVKELDSDEFSELQTTDLMHQAFSPDNGVVRWAEDNNEQRGIMYLYAGAIAGMRNPMSHRSPDPEQDRYLDDLDATIAMRFIIFIDLLLKMLERYETAQDKSEEGVES